jgi:dipeptidyl aminopeptidase/acylaminoacyl peptidase
LGCSYWGDNGEIWVIKRDGTGLRKVTNGKYPDFSPDGSKIVFVRDDGLYIINRDGSGLKRVFSDSLAFWPVWSKDGTKISFDLFRQPGLFIIDTVGIIIKQYNFNASSSSWSVLPDSLAFLDLDDHKIKIISIVSDSIKTLNIETRSSIRWSIDGRYFIVGTTIRDREGNLIFTIAP